MADRPSTAVPPEQANAFLRENFREEELEFVADCLEKGQRQRSPREPVWNESMSNYLVALPGERAVPFIGSDSVTTSSSLRRENPRARSQLKSTETSQAIDALAAQGIAMMMPNMDFLRATPVGSDDPEKARYLSRLLQRTLQAPGNYGTNYLAFKDGFILGTAIMEIGWSTRSRIQVAPVPVFDEETGMLIGRDSDVAEVVYRDAPLIKNIDRYDFWTDPSGTRISEDMVFVIKRFRLTSQEAWRLAEAGVYRKEQVKAAIRNASGVRKSQSEDGYMDRFPDISMDTATRYKMLTGFECWCEYPGKVPKGQARNRVITVLEGENVRSHINPFYDGEFPFVEVVLNPVPGRFDGLSPAEVVRYIQDSLDGLMMVANDTADLAARGVLLKAHAFGGNDDQLRRRLPGDVINCVNPDALKPLPVDTSALGFAQSEMMRRAQMIQQGTGANQPEISGDRQTATGVSEAVRLASQRVDLMVRLVEKDNYPRIGRLLHSRLRQFLSPEREATIAGERFPMTLEEIDFDADIAFNGSNQAENKFQTAAKYREAINVLGSNPDLVLVNPGLVTRYLRDGIDLVEAEEIVQEHRENLMKLRQQGMENQQNIKGGAPQGAADNMSGAVAGEVQREGVRVA